jgi:hypothetical protein
MRLSPFLVLALSICLVSARADAAAFKITVPAAGMERAGIILSFPLPSAAPATATLRDAHGTSIPLQIGADREGQFVIAALHAGVSPVFTLATPSAAPVAAITTRSSTDRLSLHVGGEPLLNFWLTPEPFPRAGIESKFARSGFINQLMTPGGA